MNFKNCKTNGLKGYRVKQEVAISLGERQDISRINMQREEVDDPDEFQEILTEFPEEYEQDSMNFNKSSDERKIEQLKNEHERTLDSYNVGMKKANQLSITGYSNYSDLNNSKNTSQDQKNNTVLFGNNFVNSSKNGSEGSVGKLKPVEAESPQKPLEKATEDKDSPEFSMKKQVEDFIKQAEENNRGDNILDKIEEENSEQNEMYKTPTQKEGHMNDGYDQNSLFSSVASYDGELKIDDELTTNNRGSEINQEWDSIVREASNNKEK